MSCERTASAASYVLGSLDEPEGTSFARHLDGCAECTRAVEELSELPALLHRVPAEVWEAGPAPVPPTLLPRVMSEVDQESPPDGAPRPRWFRPATAVVALLLAAAVAFGAGVLVGRQIEVPPAPVPDRASESPDRASESPDRPDRIRMESLGRAQVTGWVTLQDRAWGTRIEISCVYGDPWGEGWWRYQMVVRAGDGREEIAGTWRAEAGSETTVTLATAIPAEEIATIEVRTARGQSVLRLVR